MILNVNTGPFSCRKGTFTPYREPLIYVGRFKERNPADKIGAGVYSALILIGLSGKDEKYAMDDVVTRVRAARTVYVDDSSASFILQRGLYKHKAGHTVEEESVRVIILSTMGEEEDEFRENILEMAQSMSRGLKQESIIVEFQRGGVSDETYNVTPY